MRESQEALQVNVLEHLDFKAIKPGDLLSYAQKSHLVVDNKEIIIWFHHLVLTVKHDVGFTSCDLWSLGAKEEGKVAFFDERGDLHLWKRQSPKT